MTVPPSLRRAGRILGWSLLGLVLVLFFALAGGMAFLRTQPGERWIADTAVSVLKNVGIEAQIGSLEGPLPFSLHLRDVRLADGQGVWLDVPEATLRIGAGALLRGHLLVEELSVLMPVCRVPEFPPADPPPPPSDPLELLRLSSCSRWLRHCGVFEVGDGRRTARAVPARAGRGGIPLRRRWKAPVRRRISGVSWSPRCTVRKLRRLGGEPLLALSGALNLGNEGNWLSDGVKRPQPEERPDAGVGLDLRLAVPRAAGNGGDEAQGAQDAPEQGSLRLLLTLAGARFSVPELMAEVPGGLVTGHGLFFDDAKVGGDLSVLLSDPDALMRLVAALTGEAQAGLPLASANLEAALSGTLDAPGLVLKASVPGIVLDAAQPDARLDVASSWTLAVQSLLSEPSVTADATVNLGGPFVRKAMSANQAAKNGKEGERSGEVPIRLHVEASETAETLTVKALRVESEWLALAGDASLETATGKLAAALRLDMPSLRRLAQFPPVAALLTDSPFHELAGTVGLKADVRRDDASSPFAGTLSLKLADMRWGLAPLQDKVGETASLGASFSAQPESGSASVSDLTLKAGQLSGKGNASTDGKKLDAALSLALSSLKGIAPSLSGPLELKLRASGPLLSPGGELTLASPHLGVETATLEGLRVRLNTPSVGAAGGKGTLDVSATLRDASIKALQAGAPLRFSTEWQFAADRFSLHKTKLDAPGIALSGTLDALPAKRRLDGGSGWRSRTGGAAPLTGVPPMVPQRLPTCLRRPNAVCCGLVVGASVPVRFFPCAPSRALLDDLFGKQDRPVRLLGNARSDFRWRSGKIDVSGSLKRLQASVALQGKTSADIGLTLDIAGQKAQVERLTFTDRRKRTLVGVRLNRPVNIAFGNGLSVDNLDLSVLPQGTLTALGSLDGRKLALEARLRDVAINMARLFTDVPVPDGLLNAAIALSGTPSQPRGTLDVSLRNIAFPESDMPPAAVDINGTLQSSALVLNVKTDGMGTSPATGTLSLPLSFSASGVPSPALDKPCSGNVNWEGSLASLWRFVPLANSSLTGQGSLNATLSGSLSAPELSASLKIEKAAFEEILLGLALSDINLDASLQSGGMSRLSLSATDGQGGAINVNGTVGPLASGLPLSLHGTIKELAPLHRNDLSVTLSGTADIVGPATSPDVRAAITVNKGQFQIVSSFGTSIPTLNVVEAGQEESTASSSGSGPKLDVNVLIPNRFFVRGKGLESEWKGNL
ncbi:MAG: translocation/assembly module TamB domain-containing protein, partial [Bilophila wadsworthia]